MKILLTGASGYVGSRLVPALNKGHHQIVALVRNKQKFHPKSSVITIEGDLLNPTTLKNLPYDIDIAYYLVHSMHKRGKTFEDLEEKCALNFVEALKKTKVKQIIYLSGLVRGSPQSEHLRSRLRVEEVLKSSEIPCTIIRAGIIIGAGSASFEIIRDLVEKLPVMVAPRWVESRCQPISIYDVVYYLTNVLENPKCYDKTFEIGGPDVLSYRKMLLGFAKYRKLKRLIIPVPVLTPRLSSYWLYFVTSTNFLLAMSLVDSLKTEAICKNNAINKILPRKRLTYEESLALV